MEISKLIPVKQQATQCCNMHMGELSLQKCRAKNNILRCMGWPLYGYIPIYTPISSGARGLGGVNANSRNSWTRINLRPKHSGNQHRFLLASRGPEPSNSPNFANQKFEQDMFQLEFGGFWVAFMTPSEPSKKKSRTWDLGWS